MTPEDIISIKLLVAAWPESANIPRSTTEPTKTVYAAAKTRGLVELQRSILLLCPACEPSGSALCQLNYMHRRALLVLLFVVIQPKNMQPLMKWLRQLRSNRPEGMGMLRLIASYL